MTLTAEDRQVLLNAFRKAEDVGGSPKVIDAAIAQIRQRNPDAFHTAESLATRMFVHEPRRGEPCCGWQRCEPSEKIKASVRRPARDSTGDIGAHARCDANPV